MAEPIDKAAKVLAACMDYPWEHMPEQGRAQMRLHAKAVVDAALSTSPAPAEPVQQDMRGEPVAWWRISYIDPDGNSDADVQIGKNKPTGQILADNGFEWQPLYATPHPVQPEEAVARDALMALQKARAFIRIRHADLQDPAYETLTIIEGAIAALSRQQDAGERP